MAEERKVLLKIELDVSQLEKNAKDAEKELARLTPQMDELRKAGQKNTVEYKTLALESKKYNKQLTDSVKAIEINKAANEEGSGSLREMRDVLAAAKIEFQNLSKVQRDSKGGQEMTKQMDALKTEITDIEKGFGTFTGEVGKYEDAIKKALAEQNKFAGDMKDLPVDATIEDIKKLSGDMEHLGEGIIVEVTGSISKMEDRLYELALAGDTTSDEFRQLQKQTADYKKIILEVDGSIDQLAESGGALGSALELGQGVVAGYQAVTGVTALMGVENEELLEVLTKLEAAQAVLSSLEAAQLAIRRSSIKVTQAQATMQKLLTLAIGEGSKASKVFRGALLATGVGALIIGIGLLIANFDKLKAAFSSTSVEQEALNETMDAYRDGALDAIKQTKSVGSAFEQAERGVISKKEALKIYNETLGDSFGKQTDYNEAEKVFIEKTDPYIKAAGLRAQANALFAKAAEEQVKGLTADIDVNTSFGDAFLGQFTNFSFDVVKIAKDTEAQIDKELKQSTKLKSDAFTNLAEDLLAQAANIEKANGIVTDSDKNSLDAYKKSQEEKAKAAKETAERIRSIQIGNLDLTINNERKVIEAHYSFLESEASGNAEELINIAGEKNNELKLLDEKELEQSRKTISLKYDTEKELAKDNADLVASLTNEKNLQIQALEIDFNNKIVQRGEALLETQRQLSSERVEQERDALNRIAVLDAQLTLERSRGTTRELQAWKDLQSAKIEELRNSQVRQLEVIALSEAERRAIIAETEIAIQQIKNESFEQIAEQEKMSNKDIATTSLSAAQSLSNSLFQIKANQYQNELNLLSEKTDSESKLLQEQLDAGILSQADYNAKKSALDSKAAAEESKIKKAQFKADKKAALITAIINTAVGVTAAAPVVPLMVLAAALGAAEIAIIAGQPEPKFKKGGLGKSGTFGGASHASGGTKGVFSDGTSIEVEKDENFYIVNKRSSEMINKLDHLNQMGGGVPLAARGAVMKFQTGGSFAAQTSRNVENKYEQQNRLMQAFTNMPPQIVLVEDVNSAQANKIDVESRANF